MTFAGIAQRPEQRRALSKMTGSSPSPRSTILQAFVAGLQVDAADRKAGFDDGLAGPHFLPGDRDQFSYVLGFASGREKARRSNGG